jgi:hypothetical protein
MLYGPTRFRTTVVKPYYQEQSREQEQPPEQEQPLEQQQL